MRPGQDRARERGGCPLYPVSLDHRADHPLDSYGFEVFGHQWPAPANHVLALPGLPYWWALGLRPRR